jgi:hypothetical protein
MRKELDADDILKKHEAAAGRMTTWLSTLQVVYDLCLPDRAKFSMTESMPGQSTAMHVYDWTAPMALQSFANNIVMNLMPPGTNWATFLPGRKLKEKDNEPNEDVTKAMQYFEDTLFDFLNADSSNFYNSVHQALMEMGISTGVLLINEGPNKDDPFRFQAVPLHECVFGGIAGGEVLDVYRTYELEGQYIQHTWPKAKISEDTMSNINQNPAEKLTLIEGTTFHPENKPRHQYCYFIMVKESKEIILQDYRSYSPWIVFRSQVNSNELLGRGVLFTMKSALLTINRLAEDELRLNKFLSKPIFLSESGSGFNPFTSVLNPGAIIPVENSKDSIRQLQIEGNLQVQQLKKEEVRKDILDALGVNQFQSDGSGGARTATEVNVIENDRKFHNQALASRLQTELGHKVVDKCFRILKRFGYWKTPVIDNQHIKVKFVSPVTEQQNAVNIDKIVKYAQTITAVVGPELAPTAVAYGIDVKEMANYISTEMNLPTDVVRNALSQQQLVQQGAQQMAGPQQPPQAAPMGDQIAQQGASDGQGAGANQLAQVTGGAVQQ